MMPARRDSGRNENEEKARTRDEHSQYRFGFDGAERVGRGRRSATSIDSQKYT